MTSQPSSVQRRALRTALDSYTLTLPAGTLQQRTADRLIEHGWCVPQNEDLRLTRAGADIMGARAAAKWARRDARLRRGAALALPPARVAEIAARARAAALTESHPVEQILGMAIMAVCPPTGSMIGKSAWWGSVTARLRVIRLGESTGAESAQRLIEGGRAVHSIGYFEEWARCVTEIERIVSATGYAWPLTRELRQFIGALADFLDKEPRRV